jgi:superfamily II DNA or RNA helicase
MTSSSVPPPGGSEARQLVKDLASVHRLVLSVEESRAAARQSAVDAFSRLKDRAVRRELAAMPASRLSDVSGGRLRITALAKRFPTVLDVVDAPEHALQAVNGVGAQTARQAKAAADQLGRAASAQVRVRIDVDPRNDDATAVLSAVHRYRQLALPSSAVTEITERLARELPELIRAAKPVTGRWRMFFAGHLRKAAGEAALATMTGWVRYLEGAGLVEQLAEIQHRASSPGPGSSEVWADFQRHAAAYYSLLEELTFRRADASASEGHLPDDVVRRAKAQPLDDSFRTVSLRGYQTFGARFALAQRRVIIGDEMGLGKTVQALAVAAHLRAQGDTHFLVVCPASVLVNWVREIAQHTRLVAWAIHGTERSVNLHGWIDEGGVGVTTYDTLRHVHVPEGTSVSLVVLDEAHLIKNPQTQRTRQALAWTDSVERVLLLSGTPMENRVEEFSQLVKIVAPRVAASIAQDPASAGPDAFRRAVAPVYLRRNQEDVLTELPELEQIDEWERFNQAQFVSYREAVLSGSFMAMRRATFLSGHGKSPKLLRLLEIVTEAHAAGRKVVIFSFFKEVIAAVVQALSDGRSARVLGPIDGSVPPPRRQAIIDEFTSLDGGATLVSQIQAGGVGLNIQAASVVVLCEPQVKPTLEDQAIARAHRMGQVRTVQVHRLLVADSVDQRMLEILGTKARLFAQYARRSDTADSTPAAVDISEEALSDQIIRLERERLARQAPPNLAIDDADDVDEAAS